MTQNLDRRVPVHFSQEGYARLKAAADRASLPVGTFLRFIALKHINAADEEERS